MPDWMTQVRLQKIGEDSMTYLWHVDLPNQYKPITVFQPYRNFQGTAYARTWQQVRNAVNALNVGEIYANNWFRIDTSQGQTPPIPGAQWYNPTLEEWSDPPDDAPLPTQQFRDDLNAVCDDIFTLRADAEWLVAINYLRQKGGEAITKKLYRKTRKGGRYLNELITAPLEDLTGDDESDV